MTEAKVKNVTRDQLGDKVGRIHMKRQNFDSLGGRRLTALRTSGGSSKKDRPSTSNSNSLGDKSNKKKRSLSDSNLSSRSSKKMKTKNQ